MRKIHAILFCLALLAVPVFGGWNEEPDKREYRVVINHEEQYSLWFADREIPSGWKDVGFSGSKRECLAHIEEVWTDMRPLSWRKHEGWGEWRDMDDGQRYKVVINHEEQYSLWFADRPAPRGWEEEKFSGSKRDCLKHIEEVWTDMRPLSWREAWEEGR